MEHYYTVKQNINNDTVIISGDEAKHIVKVLRKSPGDEIKVTDGEGNLYTCKIVNSAKDSVECSVTDKSYGLNEPEIKVTLYQSLLKNPDRFEFAIEKSVELGVNAIQPVISEHVINKKRNKTGRWQSIALSAMKQSQRCFLPTVHSPASFEDAVKSCESKIKLIADERQNKPGVTFRDLEIETNSAVSVFIGPEGGFSEEEIEQAVKNGFKILNLGKRKYRSETAAVAALSLILI